MRPASISWENETCHNHSSMSTYPSTLHMESERRRLHRERCLALHAPSCGPAWACSGDARFGLKCTYKSQQGRGSRLQLGSLVDCLEKQNLQYQGP